MDHSEYMKELEKDFNFWYQKLVSVSTTEDEKLALEKIKKYLRLEFIDACHTIRN